MKKIYDKLEQTKRSFDFLHHRTKFASYDADFKKQVAREYMDEWEVDYNDITSQIEFTDTIATLETLLYWLQARIRKIDTPDRQVMFSELHRLLCGIQNNYMNLYPDYVKALGYKPYLVKENKESVWNEE